MSSGSFGHAVSRTPNSDTITLSDRLSAVGDYMGSYGHLEVASVGYDRNSLPGNPEEAKIPFNLPGVQIMPTDKPVPTERKPPTAAVNAQLWGRRARDWADIQEGMVHPVYEAVFARTGIGRGTRYLDVGCGAGAAAQLAAARGAKVSGLDATEPLLAIACERVPAGDFRLGDIENLPFADRAFDVVTGFNSIQYAGNPTIALAEAALREFASQAGLHPVTVFDVDCPFVYSDQESVVRGFSSGGPAARAMDLVGEEAVRAAYMNSAAPFRQPDGSYRIGASFRCLVALP